MIKGKRWKKRRKKRGEREVREVQVDNVREVKCRGYRVSPKGPGDNEQRQRCRNSIPELRQQLMIKTSSPVHTKRDRSRVQH